MEEDTSKWKNKMKATHTSMNKLLNTRKEPLCELKENHCYKTENFRR